MNFTMRKLIIVTITLCANFAFADHGLHDTGLAPAQTNSLLQLQQSLGSFEIDGEAGHWNRSYLQGEYTVTKYLSTMVGVPWVSVRREGGSSVVGLGDLSLALRGQLYSSQDTRVLFALNGELPTGDDHRGLGGGHYEVAPMVILAQRLTQRLMLTASVTHGFGFGSHHHHREGDGHEHSHQGDDAHTPDESEQHFGTFIRPHGNYETISTLGLLYSTQTGFFETAVRLGFGFDDHDDIIAAPTELRFQGGVNLDDGVALTMGSSQTIIGPRRNPWVIDFGLTMLFGDPPTQVEEEEHDHDHDHDHDHKHEH